MKILFDPEKQHLLLGRWSKNHTRLRENISRNTAVGIRSNSTARASWSRFMSTSLSSLTHLHINYYIATSFWPVSNTAEIGTWRSVNLFRSGLWGDCSTQAATAAQVTVRDRIDSCEEILSLSRKERLISHKTTGMLGAEMASSVVDETLSSAD